LGKVVKATTAFLHVLAIDNKQKQKQKQKVALEYMECGNLTQIIDELAQLKQMLPEPAIAYICVAVTHSNSASCCFLVDFLHFLSCFRH
jgi:hypothetical protein